MESICVKALFISEARHAITGGEVGMEGGVRRLCSQIKCSNKRAATLFHSQLSQRVCEAEILLLGEAKSPGAALTPVNETKNAPVHCSQRCSSGLFMSRTRQERRSDPNEHELRPQLHEPDRNIRRPQHTVTLEDWTEQRSKVGITTAGHCRFGRSTTTRST